MYWAAGGTDIDGDTGIYPGLLDYGELQKSSSVNVICFIVAVLICQVFLWGVYKFKIMLIIRYTVADPRSSEDNAVVSYQECPASDDKVNINTDVCQNNDDRV